MYSVGGFGENWFTTAILAATLVSLACWMLLKKRTYSPPLPPFPGISLPVIGHLHLLTKDMRVCFREFRKKHGDVYSLQFGSKIAVVISGYDAIKEGFKTHGDKFPNRGDMPMIDRVTRKMGNYDTWTFAQNQKNTYSSVLHSHTVLVKLCPCGRYRQLNSILYPNNHIPKSSKIIFNALVRFLVLAGNLNVGKPRFCFNHSAQLYTLTNHTACLYVYN